MPFQLESELQARHEQGLLRQRQILQSGQGASLLINGRRYLNFSSNDYLGAASQPAIVAAWQQGLAIWGAGSGASPLVTGYTGAHQQLEQALAAMNSVRSGRESSVGGGVAAVLRKHSFSLTRA